MLKKLTEQKLSDILEAGISEFAARGVDGASMNAIAARAGISVGVLYKYYADKDDFFRACLRRSLDVLRTALREIAAPEEPLLSAAETAIRAVQRTAREHADYMRMYLRLTAESSGRQAELLAEEIEGLTAELYAGRIAAAAESGAVRRDMDPRLFAFFFDNLLMMLQFSYCCDYYRARFRRYCGADAADDNERVVRELLKFYGSAFAAERDGVPDNAKEGSKP